MTQEELNAAIEADGYCKPREEIKEFDNRLYLQEVGLVAHYVENC